MAELSNQLWWEQITMSDQDIIKVWVFNLEGDVDIKKSSQYVSNKFALEEATGYQGKD